MSRTATKPARRAPAHARRTNRHPLPPGDGRPAYEVRAVPLARRGHRLELWQVPARATRRLTRKEKLAALAGRNLEYMEHRVLRRLKQAKITLSGVRPGESRTWPIPEDVVLPLALLFRTIAPMRSLTRMRQVADGIDAMDVIEACYWLGMALHRPHPRRVLGALRMLLTSP